MHYASRVMDRGKIKRHLRGVKGHSDAILAIGVVGLVLLLIIPLPPICLDTLLCFNIVFSVMALLLTLYVDNALEFSSFPSLLLFLTLYRLGLNIASTRMILTHAEGGDIIRTFGEFVTEGHVMVGIILFILLTIINFVVVTKGAGRVAEVAARFTLEALPGKQMAIDGELSAGLITQEEAKIQRRKVTQEAEFYGAMDGASKFVRGDAIAGIIITFVNILGGLCVGLMVKGLPLSQCFHLFTRLTVGDGLVSQIPALLVSVGAGIIVTRASCESLSRALTKQIFNHPKVLLITGITLLILSLVPGMPLLVMGPISAVLLLYSYILFKGGNKKEVGEEKSSKECPMEVELGVRLIAKVSKLKQQLQEIREKIEEQLGVVVPAIHIRDNTALSASVFEIKMRGSTLKSGRAEHWEEVAERIEETLCAHAHELIGRQDVARMVEAVRRVDHAVVDELVGRKLNLGQILKVLQNLLREHISIRDFPSILEALADAIQTEGVVDIEALTQSVRERLARGISEQFFGKTRVAHVITLDPKVEQMIQVSCDHKTFDSKGRLRPQTAERIAHELHRLSEQVLREGIHPVVLTEGGARSRVRRLIENKLPHLPVLAYSELTADITVESIGMVSKEILI